MIRRSTWIVLVVFAVLLGVLFWQLRSGDQEVAGEEESILPTEQVQVIKLPPGQIELVLIQDAGGAQVRLRRGSDGNWSQGAVEPVNQTNANAVASSLASMTALNILTEPPAKEAIGLSEPAYTIEAGPMEGEQVQITVGDLTPTGSGYYVQVDGTAVYVVSKFTLESVLKALTDPAYLAPTPQATP